MFLLKSNGIQSTVKSQVLISPSLTVYGYGIKTEI